MKRLAALLTLLLLLSSAASATPSQARQAALTPHRVVFPADTYVHPNAAIEWWYFVGHLSDAVGHTYGFESTFFRFGGLRQYGSPFNTLYRTDVAVTDEARGAFHHAIVYTPAIPTLTVASTTTLHLRAGALEVSTLVPWRYRIQGRMPHGRIDLVVTSGRPPMLVNGGYTGWGAGYTYYYSLTHLRTTGTLTIAGRRIAVHGVSWNDHQWGDMGGSSVTGWQWMALQLDDGTDMSLANERPATALDARWAQGLFPDNTQRYVRDAVITPLGRWRSRSTGTIYPAGWRVRVPSFGLDVVVRPTVAGQEMVDSGFLGFRKSYWEGSCTVTGQRNGHPVSGKAYTELTGYDKTSTAP